MCLVQTSSSATQQADPIFVTFHVESLNTVSLFDSSSWKVSAQLSVSFCHKALVSSRLSAADLYASSACSIPFLLFHISHALFLLHLFLGQFVQLLDETDGLPAQLNLEISFCCKYDLPVFLLYIVTHILFYCRTFVCILS